MAVSKKIKWLILIAAVLATFFVLDFNYFWANLKFLTHPPVGQNRQSQTSPISSAANNLQKFPANILQISSLGIEAPVIYIDQKTESAFQAALINGVVHYPGTAMPGQAGNAYFFGHSSDFIWSKGHYKTVFAVLPKIKIGDTILITDPSGTPFIYTAVKTAIVSPNDVSVLQQNQDGQKLLTLQTSWPVGTALKRFIVVAEIKSP